MSEPPCHPSSSGAAGESPRSERFEAVLRSISDGVFTIDLEGTTPLSILNASSIVQDGHGMLPLLSTSTRAFVLVKLINLLVGVAVGAALLAVGR